jgi:hypothetical protein
MGTKLNGPFFFICNSIRRFSRKGPTDGNSKNMVASFEKNIKSQFIPSLFLLRRCRASFEEKNVMSGYRLLPVS